MMVRRANRWCLWAAAMVCAWGGAARAESTTSTQPSNRPGDRLADEQAVVLSRLTRLEDRLYQLSQVLQKTEPEHAARLLDALSTGRNMLLRQRAQRIIDDLRAAKLSDAADSQEQMMADLAKVLKVLLNENADSEAKKEETKELLALREQLNRLLKEQEEEVRDSRTAADAERIRAQLQAAAGQLREALKKQESLSKETKAGKSAKGELSKKQGEVRKQTEAAAKAAAQAGRQGDDEDKANQASKSAEQAAKEMQEAEEKLGGERSSEAPASQEKAEEALKDALDKIEERKKEVEKSLDLLKQAEQQRDTAKKTDQLARKMDGREQQDRQQKGGEQKDGGKKGSEQKEGGQKDGGQQQKGDSQKDEKGGESKEDEGQNSPPKPGGQSVKEAVPHQQKAAEKLDQKKPHDATKEQEKALERLKQAKQDLEDALEQLRKEQQEEMLAALEARFAAMLAKQIEIDKQTNALDSAGKENWSRAQQLELADASKQQKWVGDEADTALKILKEDGTTIVVPQIIEQVRDDALDVSRRLGEADTGSDVRQVQENIVATLQELLEAVKEMQKKNESESNGGGQAGESDKTPPLMPGSAELKLLKSLQVRVNKITAEVEKKRVLPTESPKGLNDLLKGATRRQAAVAKMAKDMVEGEQSRKEAGP